MPRRSRTPWILLAALLAWGCKRGAATPAPAAQIAVVARAPDASALEIERDLAVPIEQAVAGIAGLSHVESEARDGAAHVTLTFASNDHLASARAELPGRLQRVATHEPRRPEVMADIAPGDDGLRYTLRSPTHAIDELYLANERLRTRLLGVPALADLSTCNGARRRMLVAVDPARAASRGLVLQSLLDAIVPPGPERKARAGSLMDLTTLNAGMSEGVPVLLRDVASIRLGIAPIECAAQRGQDPSFQVVEGIAWLRRGARVDEAVAGLRDAIATIRAEHLLPPGVEIAPFDFTEGAAARRLPTIDVRAHLPVEVPLLRAVEAVRAIPGAREVLIEARGFRREVGPLDLDIRVTLDDGPTGAPEVVAAAVVARLTAISAAVRCDVSIQGRATPAELRAASLRVTGADLDTIRTIAETAATTLRGIQGIEAVGLAGADVAPRTAVVPDGEAAARYGIGAADVALFARAAGDGVLAGEIGDGEQRMDLFVRIGPERVEGEAVAKLPIAHRAGGAVPLATLGAVRRVEEPRVIRRADGRRFVEVAFDVRGRSRTEGIEAARATLRAGLKLPEGVTATLDGEPL